ncbi:MAG: class I SAM-dependent methyltransferase, partial [Chloroflexi bacterium]|nr:class I SAM-dependent methyltransferase [Chloroflexota bacterium]
DLQNGGTLLDVGCGDGLIAFGALENFKQCKVIFSDISQDLLDHSQGLAEEMKVLERCKFVRAAADDLSMFENESVEAVTTRSVLIYVDAKQKSFSEFYRVLKPKGILSIFEPINRFGHPESANAFWGYDVAPIVEIARRVKAVYEKIQPADDPMLNFDERDLIASTEQARFKEVHLELQAEIKSLAEDFIKLPDKLRQQKWESMLSRAGNPKIPTLEEAMRQVLTANEMEKFMAHLRPLVETGQTVQRSSVAYLWAIK